MGRGWPRSARSVFCNGKLVVEVDHDCMVGGGRIKRRFELEPAGLTEIED